LLFGNSDDTVNQWKIMPRMLCNFKLVSSNFWKVQNFPKGSEGL